MVLVAIVTGVPLPATIVIVVVPANTPLAKSACRPKYVHVTVLVPFKEKFGDCVEMILDSERPFTVMPRASAMRLAFPLNRYTAVTGKPKFIPALWQPAEVGLSRTKPLPSKAR